MAADGTLYVSWIDSRERAAAQERRRLRHGDGTGGELPGPEIRVSASRDRGRSFGPSVVVDADACPCCRTDLALGPGGELYVAWRKHRGGDVRDVAVARSTDGGRSFGPPVLVYDDGWVFPGCPHAGPSIALDGAGALHAVWYTGAEGRTGVWYASLTDPASGFGPPEPLYTGPDVPPVQVSLDARRDGPLVAFEEWNEPRVELQLAEIPSVGGDPIPLETGTILEGRMPTVAGADGAYAVVWSEDDRIGLVWVR